MSPTGTPNCPIPLLCIKLNNIAIFKGFDKICVVHKFKTVHKVSINSAFLRMCLAFLRQNSYFQTELIISNKLIYLSDWDKFKEVKK